MITESEVRQAMAMVAVLADWSNGNKVERQLAGSLKVYVDRGEFNGTFQSAVGCLSLAGYGLEGYEENGCQCEDCQ